MPSLSPPKVMAGLAAMAALAGACGGSGDNGTEGDGGARADDATTGFGGGADGGTGGPIVSGPLAIAPQNDVVDVNYGQAAAPVQFMATVHGNSVPASFAIDRGEIGSIVAATGALTPSGAVGGTANVSATYGSQRVTTTFTVRLHFAQNGATSGDAGAEDGGSNAGGNGGVGGEGAGGPVDPATRAALQAGPDAGGAASATWLYPYDKTVWPRGLLAPLLQWSTTQTFDAVYIHLSETAFDYEGFFAATASPFVHHPIPQVAWDLLCNSNQGEAVTVTLAFAQGGQAYGPMTETWTIAPGVLTGTVYYNSYGTNLAHNLTDQGVTFGGATLGIKHGATSPVLVAGSDTECRVCHSVSADGSRLVTGNGNNPVGEYAASALYDLKNGYAETAMTPVDGRFNWGALSPDGTLLLSDGAMNSHGVKLVGSAPDNGGPIAAQLFTVATGASHASTGIPPGLVVGSPVFSPDGMHVAFNFYSGTVGAAAGDGVSLAAMDFDPKTSTFSNFRVVFTPPSGTSVWPSFLPTNDAVVFELETLSNGRDWGGTRSACDSTKCADDTASGTKAELWWVDLATKTAARLDGLNGHGYLPTAAATDHTSDEILNYEPTVNPVPSGGYAWVVFTSRRLYGNIATLKPYWSDPRYVDLSSSPTTKKLWVAAVDLSGKAGTDTSHPAFYLPAQELLAGNSRGYWVVDPCEANGATCVTGDQCCGGYCENNGSGFVCSAQPPACSNLNDKCTTATDCCGTSPGTLCIDGRCAQPAPTIPK